MKKSLLQLKDQKRNRLNYIYEEGTITYDLKIWSSNVVLGKKNLWCPTPNGWDMSLLMSNIPII